MDTEAPAETLRRTELKKQRWLRVYLPRPAANIKLFCFPYLGGGAQIYRRWPEFLSENIELNAVQLQGREDRRSEAAARDLKAMAATIAELLATSQKPIALYGHSFGGLLAFEVARQLCHLGKSPLRVFISSRQAPHLRIKKRRAHLPRLQLINELKRLGGTPAEILSDEALIDQALPTIRANITAIESYSWSESMGKSEFPITAIAARQDTLVPADSIRAWQYQSKSPITFTEVDGDHFYLNSNPASAITEINKLAEY